MKLFEFLICMVVILFIIVTVYIILHPTKKRNLYSKINRLLKNPNANDYFSIANIYRHELNDEANAVKYFGKSLKSLNKENRYDPVIIDRIVNTVDDNNINIIMEEMGTVDIAHVLNINPLEADEIMEYNRDIFLNEIRQYEENLIKNDALHHKDDYFGHKIHWRDDPQNVHDTNINVKCKEILDKIRKTNGLLMPYETFRNWAISRDATLEPVFRTVDKDYIYGDYREKDIFQNIWTRINAPVNASRKTELENALLDSLKNTKDVCVTGRINSCLQIFSYLDAEEFGPLLTKDIIRNEIFTKCGKIMLDNADKTDEEKLKLMEEEIKSNKNLNQTDIDRLLMECKAAFYQ